MDSDVIVLVTEPTPFGVYDLKLAYEAFSPLGKSMGVVINRAGIGDEKIYEFCRRVNLKILAEIPFDRQIAEAYSRGTIIPDACPQIRPIFIELIKNINHLLSVYKEACLA